MKIIYSIFIAVMCLSMTACLKQNTKDYSAFEAHKPKSILVLPPINNTPDVKATYSFLSTTSMPIAEAGYYVYPVAMVDQMFKQNGITIPAEMHRVSPKKLRSIFGADAAMYITLSKYGPEFKLIKSVTTVAASAKLVDLRTGKQLWEGDVEQELSGGSNAGGGIIGAIIGAAIDQAVKSSMDEGYTVSKQASAQLFSPKSYNGGLLYGHRAPQKTTRTKK